MKRCIKCDAIKLSDEFQIRHLCVNPSSVCNDCRRSDNAERNRAYRQRNKDAINARLAERRKTKKNGGKA